MPSGIFYIPGGDRGDATNCCGGAFVVGPTVVSTTRAFRPGLMTDAASPNQTLFESSDDGHLKWRHSDGTLHVLCDVLGGS